MIDRKEDLNANLSAVRHSKKWVSDIAESLDSEELRAAAKSLLEAQRHIEHALFKLYPKEF